MFIIEGSDNLGKTTAAKRIVDACSDTKVYYAHMSRPKPGFNFGTDYLERMSVNAVQDRFHLGALAWHDDVMTPTNLRLIEAHLRLMGSFIVVFVASDKKWYEQHLISEAKDEMFAKDIIMRGNDRFMSMLPRVDHDVMWDVSTDGFPNEGVLNVWIQQWRDRVHFTKQFTSSSFSLG